MQHYCGENYDPPMHDWIPRVPDPKVCPRCKRYLNQPAKKEKQEPAKEVIVIPPEKKVQPVVEKKPQKPKTVGGQGLLISEEEVIPSG